MKFAPAELAPDAQRAAAAHDLRNTLLMPLGLRVELASRALQEGRLAAVGDALIAIQELLAHGDLALRRFADGQLERRMVDLDELARDAVGLASAQVVSHTRIVLDLAAGCTIEVDREAVIAAVVNLVLNALEAVAERSATPPDGTVTIRTTARPDSVQLEVEDNGPGISQAVRDRLFLPHVTTKRGGHGLGLISVAACVRAHGAAIEVASTPGKGAKFTLVFRRSSPTAE